MGEVEEISGNKLPENEDKKIYKNHKIYKILDRRTEGPKDRRTEGPKEDNFM